MFNFSMPELSLVLVIALMVFGPGKLPELGKGLGKGLQEFKRATTINLDESKALPAKAQHQEKEKKCDEPNNLNA